MPHSYNVMHGGSYGMDNFEILSAVTSMDYTYYTSPGDSYDHPGKNILNEDSHYDGSDANWTLNYNVYTWTEVTSTILQVPQPLGITVDTSIVGCGSPDHVYLKAVYDRLDGTTGEQTLSNFSPRCTTWTALDLDAGQFCTQRLDDFLLPA